MAAPCSRVDLQSKYSRQQYPRSLEAGRETCRRPPPLEPCLRAYKRRDLVPWSLQHQGQSSRQRRVRSLTELLPGVREQRCPLPPNGRVYSHSHHYRLALDFSRRCHENISYCSVGLPSFRTHPIPVAWQVLIRDSSMLTAFKGSLSTEYPGFINAIMGCLPRLPSEVILDVLKHMPSIWLLTVGRRLSRNLKTLLETWILRQLPGTLTLHLNLQILHCTTANAEYVTFRPDSGSSLSQLPTARAYSSQGLWAEISRAHLCSFELSALSWEFECLGYIVYSWRLPTQKLLQPTMENDVRTSPSSSDLTM